PRDAEDRQPHVPALYGRGPPSHGRLGHAEGRLLGFEHADHRPVERRDARHRLVADARARQALGPRETRNSATRPRVTTARSPRSSRYVPWKRRTPGYSARTRATRSPSRSPSAVVHGCTSALPW